jgi:hypothetical protein
MDPVRPEPMTDAALDREIAAALNVEPAPAFVARVRQRVAHAPVRPVWGMSWSAGAAASLAFAVVAAIIFWIDSSGPRTGVTRYDRPSRQPGFIESRTMAGISELQADRRSGRLSPKGNHSLHAASIVRPSSVVSGFSRTTSVVSGFSRTTPEILIDPREANALRALLAAASAGQIDLTRLAGAPAAESSEPQPPPEIVIAPLVIPPLAPEPGKGERQ